MRRALLAALLALAALVGCAELAPLVRPSACAGPATDNAAILDWRRSLGC